MTMLIVCRVQVEYGETVDEWVAHGRRKREEKRVKEIEDERRQFEELR